MNFKTYLQEEYNSDRKTSMYLVKYWDYLGELDTDIVHYYYQLSAEDILPHGSEIAKQLRTLTTSKLDEYGDLSGMLPPGPQNIRAIYHFVIKNIQLYCKYNYYLYFLDHLYFIPYKDKKKVDDFLHDIRIFADLKKNISKNKKTEKLFNEEFKKLKLHYPEELNFLNFVSHYDSIKEIIQKLIDSGVKTFNTVKILKEEITVNTKGKDPKGRMTHQFLPTNSGGDIELMGNYKKSETPEEFKKLKNQVKVNVPLKQDWSVFDSIKCNTKVIFIFLNGFLWIGWN